MMLIHYCNYVGNKIEYKHIGRHSIVVIQSNGNAQRAVQFCVSAPFKK